MKNIIEVKNLTKDYGRGKGIFDISIDVKEGEVFGFLGPNGAGKTTTIRNLLGFIRPQEGECKILNMDCYKDAPKIQGNLGYLAGEIAFLDDLNGEQMIEFIASMKGKEGIISSNISLAIMGIILYTVGSIWFTKKDLLL